MAHQATTGTLPPPRPVQAAPPLPVWHRLAPYWKRLRRRPCRSDDSSTPGAGIALLSRTCLDPQVAAISPPSDPVPDRPPSESRHSGDPSGVRAWWAGRQRDAGGGQEAQERNPCDRGLLLALLLVLRPPPPGEATGSPHCESLSGQAAAAPSRHRHTPPPAERPLLSMQAALSASPVASLGAP